jgi:hypothetical protein
MIGPVSILPGSSAAWPLPDLLDEGHLLRLLPYAAYDRIHPEGLRLWCHKNARYGLPTIECIDWLRKFIGGRSAIEIGAGYGDLAYHLGIPATDSHCAAAPAAPR